MKDNEKKNVQKSEHEDEINENIDDFEEAIKYSDIFIDKNADAKIKLDSILSGEIPLE